MKGINIKRSFDSIRLSLIQEIAHAETKDNKRYQLYVDRSCLRGRLNNIGCAVLDVSAAGWNSQMMASSQTLDLDGRILLFYCGNSFGREGFGIAEMTGRSGR